MTATKHICYTGYKRNRTGCNAGGYYGNRSKNTVFPQFTWHDAKISWDDGRFLGTDCGQYESGTRTPKINLINELSQALSISPDALTVPDIDSGIGLMHTLFAIEDMYGLTISKIDDRLCLTWQPGDLSNLSLMQRFSDWQKEAERLHAGEISKEEYDQWRYTYPEIPVARQKAERDAKRISEKQTENE